MDSVMSSIDDAVRLCSIGANEVGRLGARVGMTVVSGIVAWLGGMQPFWMPWARLQRPCWACRLTDIQ